MSIEKDNNINNSNGRNNNNNNNNNNNMNDILQTIANLSSQSNESSNIILNAISNGITTGVSQGIASGNIAVSFQDLISLVSLFKPTNEIPLQLINRIPTFDTYHGPTTSNSQASNTIHSDGHIGKTLANPDSHDFNQASSRIPSSVHVFDVTVEKYPAQELPVSLRVSETADDQNVKRGNVSNGSDEVCLGGSIYGSSLDTGSTSRKRSNQFISEDDSSDQLNSRLRHDSLSMRQNSSVIESLLGLNEHISTACVVMTEELEVAHNKVYDNQDFDNSVAHNINANNCLDLMTYVYSLIDLCGRADICFHDQSLVILEVDANFNSSDDGNSDSSSPCLHFFDKNRVSRIIAVERPKSYGQMYIADGLRMKYHFSCPTVFIPSLLSSIQSINNRDVLLLFIPRTNNYFKCENHFVINNISIPSEFCGEDAKAIYGAVLECGTKYATGNVATAGKRSNFSCSIGLQTMYSHEQHRARYSMLPHSKPHVPTVREYPSVLVNSILNSYNLVIELIQKEITDRDSYPFYLSESTKSNEMEGRQRLSLRADLVNHLRHSRQQCDVNIPPTDIMFESCTVQPTGALGFHKDTMNCERMDKTIAFIVPIESLGDSEDYKSCLSYLFYSRKCVGDYANKMAILHTYINDPTNCDLTRLCLKSLLNTNGTFDYQGTLFEAEKSLNSIARSLENMKDYSCPEVQELCQLSCFKHGAAFDKMGYYSIFVNVFLGYHYMGLATNIDDSIGLCMFFGLICNGTSTLATIWRCTYDLGDQSLKWLEKRNRSTKLFDLLVKMNRVMYNPNQEKDKAILYGNCKLPRFQYANHANGIIQSSTKIHKTVKEFLLWRNASGKTKDDSFQHNYLYNKLKTIKGIGPLSFNQFWHSMCLCGILPHGSIQSAAVAPASGPGKLIKTFYPYLNSSAKLTKKMSEVTSEINKLGLKTINGFFVENTFCEIWRLASTIKSFKTSKNADDKRKVFLSVEFEVALKNAKPTRYPDIYYKNPFTDEYQHLFRVVNKELIMRPSFAANINSGSVNVHCNITHDETSGNAVVTWVDDQFPLRGREPADLFLGKP